MCQNNKTVERQCDSATVLKFFIFVAALLFCCTAELVKTAIAYAEPLKISLLLGDTHTKSAVDTIKAINTKTLDIDIKVYPLKEIRARDLTHLKDSSLIIVNIMGRQIIEEVKNELTIAVSKGAKVYAVAAGGSYNDEIKAMGIIHDKKVDEYYGQGGVENFKNMLYYCLKKDFGFALNIEDVRKTPEFAIYDSKTKRLYESFDEFIKAKGQDYAKRPLIGLTFYKNSYESGQLLHIDAIIKSLEKEGFGVLSVYGYPSESVVERFFFDEMGNARVRAVVGLS
ncbi:MAG: cobaltochelatase subunit CobN, partial [Thermodesulfovibrionales bacterium]|nr:cobaltochelatase subunit CobN [Thermodesulfovibrionales bacterium]